MTTLTDNAYARTRQTMTQTDKQAANVADKQDDQAAKVADKPQTVNYTLKGAFDKLGLQHTTKGKSGRPTAKFTTVAQFLAAGHVCMRQNLPWGAVDDVDLPFVVLYNTRTTSHSKWADTVMASVPLSMLVHSCFAALRQHHKDGHILQAPKVDGVKSRHHRDGAMSTGVYGWTTLARVAGGCDKGNPRDFANRPMDLFHVSDRRRYVILYGQVKPTTVAKPAQFVNAIKAMTSLLADNPDLQVSDVLTDTGLAQLDSVK